MGNESSKQKGRPGTGTASAIQAKLTGKSGPSSTVVQRHLENALKSRILQLKATGLKRVPDELAEVSAVLRNLDLSQNKLRELPLYIGNFGELKQLHLSDNALECLPDELGMLRKLEILNVAGNRLSSLPESLVGCGSLRTLSLAGNVLSAFPLVICHLRQLDILDLSKNKITELPDEIASMTATELNMNQNQLHSLNSRSLVQCPRLKIVRVEENCLPREAFDQCLLQDSNIALLAISGNLIQEKEFQQLPGYEAYQQRVTATRRKM